MLVTRLVLFPSRRYVLLRGPVQEARTRAPVIGNQKLPSNSKLTLSLVADGTLPIDDLASGEVLSLDSNVVTSNRSADQNWC